jgi:hypothetical protein
MTFLEAYAIHGPDVERLAYALDIPRPEADRLINRELDRRYVELRRLADARRSA